jgi:hypothetical protein
MLRPTKNKSTMFIAPFWLASAEAELHNSPLIAPSLASRSARSSWSTNAVEDGGRLESLLPEAQQQNIVTTDSFVNVRMI